MITGSLYPPLRALRGFSERFSDQPAKVLMHASVPCRVVLWSALNNCGENGRGRMDWIKEQVLPAVRPLTAKEGHLVRTRSSQ